MNINHTWIQRVFEKCGNWAKSNILHYTSIRNPEGFAFAEHEIKEAAQNKEAGVTL